jgi:hypothetical protein
MLELTVNHYTVLYCEASYACDANNPASLISHKPKRIPGAVTMERCVKCQLAQSAVTHLVIARQRSVDQCKVSQQASNNSSTRRPLHRNIKRTKYEPSQRCRKAALATASPLHRLRSQTSHESCKGCLCLLACPTKGRKRSRLSQSEESVAGSVVQVLPLNEAKREAG